MATMDSISGLISLAIIFCILLLNAMGPKHSQEPSPESSQAGLIAQAAKRICPFAEKINPPGTKQLCFRPSATVWPTLHHLPNDKA
jgi:hypothetical protein